MRIRGEGRDVKIEEGRGIRIRGVRIRRGKSRGVRIRLEIR